MDQPVYLLKEIKEIVRTYNPDYGDGRNCKCGHPYYRHFDSFDNMADVGCKYCCCYTFVENFVEA